VIAADLAHVALHDEHHAGLEERSGVRLRVLRVADARVLLLQPDAVHHALIALGHEPLRDDGRSLGQLATRDAGGVPAPPWP
jgi:hypothetical protein